MDSMYIILKPITREERDERQESILADAHERSSSIRTQVSGVLDAEYIHIQKVAKARAPFFYGAIGVGTCGFGSLLCIAAEIPSPYALAAGAIAAGFEAFSGVAQGIYVRVKSAHAQKKAQSLENKLLSELDRDVIKRLDAL